MSSVAVAVVMMSVEEARACIDRIKAQAEEIAVTLIDLRDREGWRALGYATWQDCLRREFNMSRQRAHQLISAHVVERVLAALPPGPASNAFDAGVLKERHRAELAPLVDEPERIDAVVGRAAGKRAGKTIRAEDVRVEVSREIGRPVSRSSKPSVRSGAEASDSQDIPDEIAFPASSDLPAEPADLGIRDDVSPTVVERWCQDCGSHYRGAICPCSGAPAAPDQPGAAGRQDAVVSPDALTAAAPDPMVTTTPAAAETARTGETPSQRHQLSNDLTRHGYGGVKVGAGKTVTPSPPAAYRPPVVDGAAPVYVYPSAEGLQNAVESHLGGAEFDAFDRWYQTYRREVAARRRQAGQAVDEERPTITEVKASIDRLESGVAAVAAHAFHRLDAEAQQRHLEMCRTVIASRENPQAVGLARMRGLA